MIDSYTPTKLEQDYTKELPITETLPKNEQQTWMFFNLPNVSTLRKNQNKILSNKNSEISARELNLVLTVLYKHNAKVHMFQLMKFYAVDLNI